MDPVAWIKQLKPASFAGLRFQVESTQITGGTTFATEIQVGRGHRALPIAQGLRIYRFEAFLTGERVLARSNELTARFDQGPGPLVHPHFGALEALAQRWTVEFEGRGVFNYAKLSLEFVNVEIAEQLEVIEPEVPTDLPSVEAALVEQAAEFADEPNAATELVQAAPVLDIDETATTSPEYTQAATEALMRLSLPGLPPVPAVLGQLGAALRRADAGQLEASEAESVAAALLRQAARVDSLTLMDIRLTWLSYVRALGANAIGEQIAGRGRTLPAVAAAAGVDIDELAARNPAAVLAWFARDGVKL